MKTFFLLTFISILLEFSVETFGAQQVPIQKKTKLVTYENQIIMTRNWVIINDSILFKVTEGNYKNINLKEIKGISIKKGSTFPLVMGTCIGTGLMYSYLNGNIPKNHKFGGGLITGIIAGLIVAPFIKQPLTLIYFDGKWKDDKYKPK